MIVAGVGFNSQCTAEELAALVRRAEDTIARRAERLEPIGSLHGFRPARTITQWAAVKP